MNENERSAAIDLITEINQYVSTVNIVIKKAGGEITMNNFKNAEGNSRKIMFPDVLLYSDTNKINLLQGWELKMPDVSVHDNTYILDAQDKAEKLGLNTTVLWNFHEVVLYVKNNGQWIIEKQWGDLLEITTREDVVKKQIIWKNFLPSLLRELNEFYHTGVIKEKKLDEISDRVTTYLIEDHKQLLADHLKSKAKENRIIDAKINEWWKVTKIEYLKDEADPYIAFSKNILLNWITRFIFGNLIMPVHDVAKCILDISTLNKPDEVNNMFEKITKISDYYTIFQAQQFNNLLPELVWNRLIDFNAFLNDKVVTHEILQQLLESSVNQFKREIIGQYTTPENVAKLLVLSTVVDSTSNDIDPCCGTGTIPKEVMKLKQKLGITEREIHDTTWASDKMMFPLQVANMALTTPTSMNMINKVFQRNVFSLANVSETVKITSPETGELMEFTLPKFKNILSNLPFVPFEIIEKNEKNFIDNVLNKLQKDTDGKIMLSRKSDFYYYIILSLNDILDVNGRIGVILSNSWLGTVAGKEFFKALSFYFNIKTIVISGNGRWFQNAKVISSILILEKKERFEEIQKNPIQFLVINKKIGELNSSEISSIANSILSSASNSLVYSIEYSLPKVESYLENKLSLNTLFYDVTWLDDVQSVLVPLTDVFTLIRGMRRGWDALFYPEKGHSIEGTYISKILKNTKDTINYDTVADADAFCCSKTIEELEELGHNGALGWIKRFETGVNKVGKPLPEVLGNSRQLWYEMRSDGATAEIITSLNPGKRLFWAKLDSNAFINQRLVGLTRSVKYSDESVDLLQALLNSIIGLFFIEASGFGRGDGVLDLSAHNVKQIKMLNPSHLTNEQRVSILIKFNKLKSTPIPNTLEGIESRERMEFDEEVLRSYGLIDNYEKIKLGLTRMLKTRLSVND